MDFKKSMIAGVLALSTVVGAGAASASSSYTVTGNDTMWTISKKYGISLSSLIQANSQISNPNMIWSGMKLTIPGSSSKAGSTAQKPSSSANISSFASQVFSIVNQERAKAGLNSLAIDGPLSAMALDKAKDMYTNHYFDHNSPTYGSPFNMMSAYGIRYSYAGENIAMGQRTPQEVMTSWMNSPGHRQNILSPNFKKIGVAYYNGEWVQEFIAN